MADSVVVTEVDGVPTVFAPSSGPIMAGLVFRVGQADETLARRGVTHLIEHLVLHRTGQADYHYNGVTCDTTTTFHMRGSGEDVATFFREVCAGIRDLPLERTETEKALLRTEAAGKERSAATEIPMWRYGARGYGLVSFPEFGLDALDGEFLASWARTWFTKENCALWITGGDIPAGLSLPLPTGGRRQPLPAVTSALPVTPAYFEARTQGVVMDAVVSRGAAATVYARVLERELYRALRHEGGYSYQISTGYDPVDADVATLTAMADALPDQKGAVLGGMIDVLMKLNVGRVEREDIDATLSQAAEAITHPEVEAARVPGYALNLLTDEPIVSAEVYLERLRAVTGEDVQKVAAEVMRSALLMVPHGHGPDWAGFTPAPTASDHIVAGNRYAAIGQEDSCLMVGPSGVSVVHGQSPATVRFDQCVLMLAWPDGGRHLAGPDGIWAQIEPSLFRMDFAAIAAVDAAVDPSVVVVRPTRRPDEIPQPDPDQEAASAQGTASAQGSGSRKAIGTWGVAARAALIVLAIMMCGVSALCTGLAFVDTGDKETEEGGWILAGISWFCLAVFLVPAVIGLRDLVRSRRRF